MICINSYNFKPNAKNQYLKLWEQLHTKHAVSAPLAYMWTNPKIGGCTSFFIWGNVRGCLGRSTH